MLKKKEEKKRVPDKTAPTDQENNQTLEYCSQKYTAASLQPSPPRHFAYPCSFHCPLSDNRGISNAMPGLQGKSVADFIAASKATSADSASWPWLKLIPRI